MNSCKIKEEICAIGRMMHHRRLISGFEGNISVKISDYEIWITPSGVSKGFLTPDMLVRLDSNGSIRSEGMASSEAKVHLRVYREAKEISAVVHAHPIYASAYAAAHKALDQFYLTENVLTLGVVPVAPYAVPSTEEMAEAVAPLIAGRRALLLANHGALTWGKNLKEAYFLMESLEAAAETGLIAERIGGKAIPPDKISVLEKYRKK